MTPEGMGALSFGAIMSSINTNVSSMLARRVLGQQQSMMTQTLERLSTGVSINRGSDNPAGLIASESLRAEKAAINAAIVAAAAAEAGGCGGERWVG